LLVVQLSFESGVDRVKVLLNRLALSPNKWCKWGAMVLIRILEPIDLFDISVHIMRIVLFSQEQLKEFGVRNVILHDLLQILL
jgi:hypothetical protein